MPTCTRPPLVLKLSLRQRRPKKRRRFSSPQVHSIQYTGRTRDGLTTRVNQTAGSHHVLHRVFLPPRIDESAMYASLNKNLADQVSPSSTSIKALAIDRINQGIFC
ncbi:hypothetical protein ARMGADRAFT_189764 [Armillaria gallica]|uniref:Uncharacterized protein n=1 Tax=Armillaria gallica TaxID=47427 RepID=A0A2H3DCK7_ARMGA|nr:hypothetical protein ARMGADRAFT_189764 [Armillaria gallica]